MPRAQTWLTLLASTILLVGAVCSVVPSSAITHWVAKEGFLSPSPADILNSQEILSNITKLIQDDERRDIGVMALLSQVQNQKPTLSRLSNLSTNQGDKPGHTVSGKLHQPNREAQTSIADKHPPGATVDEHSRDGAGGDAANSRQAAAHLRPQARGSGPEGTDQSQGRGHERLESSSRVGWETDEPTEEQEQEQEQKDEGVEEGEQEVEDKAIIAVEMRSACDNGACAPTTLNPSASTCTPPSPSSSSSSSLPSEQLPYCGSASEAAALWRAALEGTCALAADHSRRGGRRKGKRERSAINGSGSSNTGTAGAGVGVEDKVWRWMMLSPEHACRQDEDPLITLATHPLSTSAIAVCGPPPLSAAYDYMHGMKEHLSIARAGATTPRASSSSSSSSSTATTTTSAAPSAWHWLPPAAVPELLLIDLVADPRYTATHQQRSQKQPDDEEEEDVGEGTRAARAAHENLSAPSSTTHAPAVASGYRAAAAAAAARYEEVQRVKSGGGREPASLVAAARVFAEIAKELQEAEERERRDGNMQRVQAASMEAPISSLPTTPSSPSAPPHPAAASSTAAAAASVHCLRNALEGDPLFRPGLLALGKTMLAKGFTLDAERLFTRATRSSPSWHRPSSPPSVDGGAADTKAAAHYWLARTLQQQRRFDRALHEYDTALTLDPTMKHAAYHRANLIGKMRGKTDRPLLLQTLLLIACASAITLVGVYVLVVRQQPQPQPPCPPTTTGSDAVADGNGVMAGP